MDVGWRWTFKNENVIKKFVNWREQVKWNVKMMQLDYTRFDMMKTVLVI